MQRMTVMGALILAFSAGPAAADIQTLTSEKARTSQEIEDGATSIIPVGAVAHIFGGSEKQGLEIGTGAYNKKLDAKIAAIQAQCNTK
jgi:hypothetical protein